MASEKADALKVPRQSSHKLSQSISSARSFEAKTTEASATTSATALSDQDTGIESAGKSKADILVQTEQSPQCLRPIEAQDLRKLSKFELEVLAARQARGADVIEELERRFEVYRALLKGFDVVLKGEDPDFKTYDEECLVGELREEWDVVNDEIFLYYKLTKGIDEAIKWQMGDSL